MKKHVKAKKWEMVEHFHRGTSTADTDYGVNGVPHVVLIDTHGKIAYAGHPATRKLENDIDTLLKGEKLTGEGVSSGADAGGDTNESLKEEGFLDLDTNKVDAELNDF